MGDVFEERFVVFIDILGFGAMVTRAACCQIEAERIDSALEKIKKLENISIDQCRSHIFSDCIYISVPKKRSLVSKLFKELAELTIDLMREGVWIRGGIVLGNISKRDDIPWGPALVEAYRIESQVAEFPRICFGASALKYVRYQMDGKERDNLIRRAPDGVWALQPIIWTLSYDYLQRSIAKEIMTKLDSARAETVDNPKVFKKINWLCKAWNNQICSQYPDCEVKLECRP